MKIGCFEFDKRFFIATGWGPFALTFITWISIIVTPMPFPWSLAVFLLLINYLLIFTAYPSPKRLYIGLLILVIEMTLAPVISITYITYKMIPFANTAAPLVQTYPWNIILAILPSTLLILVLVYSFYGIYNYQKQKINESRAFQPPYCNYFKKEIYFNSYAFRNLPKRRKNKPSFKTLVTGKEKLTFPQKVKFYAIIGYILWISNFAILMYAGRGWTQAFVAYTLLIGLACTWACLFSLIFVLALNFFKAAKKNHAQDFRLAWSKKTDFSDMTYEEVYGTRT